MTRYPASGGSPPVDAVTARQHSQPRHRCRGCSRSSAARAARRPPARAADLVPKRRVHTKWVRCRSCLLDDVLLEADQRAPAGGRRYGRATVEGRGEECAETAAEFVLMAVLAQLTDTIFSRRIAAAMQQATRAPLSADHKKSAESCRKHLTPSDALVAAVYGPFRRFRLSKLHFAPAGSIAPRYAPPEPSPKPVRDLEVRVIFNLVIYLRYE